MVTRYCSAGSAFGGAERFQGSGWSSKLSRNFTTSAR